MAKNPDLKLVEAHPDPARAGLAAAIVKRDEAERNYEQSADAVRRAEDALKKARSRAFEASEIIEEEALNRADALASAFLNGTEARSSEDAKAARTVLKEAEHEIAALIGAVEKLRGRLVTCDFKRRDAQKAVDRAREAALVEHACRILEETRVAQEALGAKRAALATIMKEISSTGPHADVYREINSFRAQPLISHEFNQRTAEHPEAVRLQSFIGKLHHDTAAVAPQ